MDYYCHSSLEFVSGVNISNEKLRAGFSKLFSK